MEQIPHIALSIKALEAVLIKYGANIGQAETMAEGLMVHEECFVLKRDRNATIAKDKASA